MEEYKQTHTHTHTHTQTQTHTHTHTHPTSKFYMLSSLGNYIYAKNLRHRLFPSRDIDEQSVQSYWTRTHFGL